MKNYHQIKKIKFYDCFSLKVLARQNVFLKFKKKHESQKLKFSVQSLNQKNILLDLIYYSILVQTKELIDLCQIHTYEKLLCGQKMSERIFW